MKAGDILRLITLGAKKTYAGPAAEVVVSLLELIVDAVRERGESVESIIAKIKEPKPLEMPWPSQAHSPVGETARETPAAKKVK